MKFSKEYQPYNRQGQGFKESFFRALQREKITKEEYYSKLARAFLRELEDPDAPKVFSTILSRIEPVCKPITVGAKLDIPPNLSPLKKIKMITNKVIANEITPEFGRSIIDLLLVQLQNDTAELEKANAELAAMVKQLNEK